MVCVVTFTFYFIIIIIIIIIIINDIRHQFDSLFVINVFWGPKSCPFTMDIIGLRVPTRNLRGFFCFMLVHLPKIVLPPGVPLRQNQFVINCISSEGKLSHLATCHIILFQYYKVS
jgi:hypothetical protein